MSNMNIKGRVSQDGFGIIGQQGLGNFFQVPHIGTGLICEMVLVKKLKLEASGHECSEKYS
jgi:hypothetical protein